ncbi:neutral alpha-glucosidase AB-like [Zophobas morio]|uniref:neutral alpha-glucosidase AB-like n=1 Tax=Zophobas morio TaxID=2755281 RepID=UPI00308276AC
MIANERNLLKFEAAKNETESSVEETFNGFTDSKPRGNTAVSLDFTFNTFYLYGIPEHADALLLRDTEETPYRLYNLDVFEYEVHSPAALYGHVPFLLAHSVDFTTGLLWLNSAETWVDLESGTEKEKLPRKHTQWISESGLVDFFVFYGPKPKDVSYQYSRMTGTTCLPPRWALGYHQCRWNYNDVADVVSVLDNFDKHNLPVDVLWLDIEHTDQKKYFTWDPKKFEQPDIILQKLHQTHRKLVTIVDPHIKKDPDYQLHQALLEKDFYVKDKEGRPYEGHCWPGSSMWPDFINPDMRNFWANQFVFEKYPYSTNDLHIWNDMNEPSVFNGPETTMPKDNLHFGGFEHRDVHNIYGLQLHRATAEGLMRRSGYTERPFVLSRAFFAGSQRYGAVWTGDNAATWEHLAVSVPMLLSLNIAGLPFCGADVGGFFGDPSPELMVRWYQLGAFYPFFRAHSHVDTKRREPWLFEEPYLDRIRAALRHRYNILAYMYTLFHESHLNGTAIMRPLWYEFEDESLYTVEDAFMLGSALYVAPVLREHVTEMFITFPGEENWYHLITNEKRSPGTFLEHVDLSFIPVYQRGGTVLTIQKRSRRSSQIINNFYTLRVVLDSKGRSMGVLYTDDGSTFDFKAKSAYCLVRYSAFDQRLESRLGHFSASTFDNRIEEVIIIGVQKKVAKVLLHFEEDQLLSLSFKQNLQRETLIVKNPAVSVASEWILSWQLS